MPVESDFMASRIVGDNFLYSWNAQVFVEEVTVDEPESSCYQFNNFVLEWLGFITLGRIKLWANSATTAHLNSF